MDKFPAFMQSELQVGLYALYNIHNNVISNM